MAVEHGQALSEIAEDFLRDYFAFYPTTASMLGLHDYDGRVTDFQPEAIATRIAALERYRERLNQVALEPLNRLETFDYHLLRWRTEAELWNWTERRDHTRNPMFYTNDAMVDTYITRDYAPLEVRIEALTRHLHQIPQLMEAACQNLGPDTPRILIEESLPMFDGLITFLNDDLDKVSEGNTLPDALRQALGEARNQAIEAIQGMKRYLSENLLPTAPHAFAIGEKLFREMLHYHELVDLSIDQLLAIGKADLERNSAAIRQIAEQIDPSRTIQEHMHALGSDHPSADRLLDETRALLEKLRAFLIEHDIVTIPNGGTCRVEETPPFARWAFAMMDTAGPFEQHATDSFYYITLPETSWSPEQIEGWLTKFDYATMTGVSIHEAYPGHYIHFLKVRSAPTTLSRVFDSYSHVESWAHYVEQMMLEQGYGAGDLRLRMAQLAEALVRNCRYVCAIEMHTRGMSVEEATDFFVQHAYMDRVTATHEARRGTHDPGYINYTLGKLMLLKLLEDHRAARGNSFSLKDFHDEYISYGAPPIPLLRTMMLANHSGNPSATLL